MKISHLHRTLCAVTVAALSLALPLSAFASFNGILPLTTSGSMPAPLASPTITMSNYNLTIGQSATVTFAFPAAPLGFTASDTSATNGTISNLATTSNPDVYTATFTPNPQTGATTNVISVKGKVIGANYTDASFNQPYGLAFDGTNMWLTNSNNGDIDKITPSGTVTAYTGFDGPSGIAFDGTHLWVTNYGGPTGVGSGNGTTVVKVGLNGAIIGSPITVALAPVAIAFDGTNMWVASYVDGVAAGVVTEIASTSAVTLTATTSPGPQTIAFDGTNMWTANFGSNNDGSGHSVTKISSTGTSTNYVGTGYGPIGIAFDGTNMWTANFGSFDNLFRFEGNSNSVTKVTPSGTMTTYTGTGDGPNGIAFDGTNMWVTNYGSSGTDKGSITEVAPDGILTTYTGLGYSPAGIAFDGTNMWVANNNNGGISGGDTVTKISGTIASGTSANYVVNTFPKAVGEGSSGGSVSSQVANLNAMGKTAQAQALQAQWAGLFSTTSPLAATSTAPIFKRTLKFGMTGVDVMNLQRYLNSHGFTLAATGSGSPGQETQHFGKLTFDALVKFQNAHATAILTPLHLASGTGLFGTGTIAFIASH